MDQAILFLAALFICFLVFRPGSWFWRALNWMMINGYLFPKTMRNDMRKNLERIDRENEKLDDIINNRSI